MNSYNDNLNSVVVSSLQAQELENQQLNSDRIAAMFTLYHAEGATINAYEKLEADKKILQAKGVILDQAVQNENLITNLLASATQAANYVAQSVTNTSVAAANTQIAGNAILKLAGDMGNVFSIVNAADFDTEIYVQGKEAMELINDTAYLAEVATQVAMNASIQTSEVSAPTVLSKAKATNTQMGNLEQIISNDFNTMLQSVLADTNNLSAASVTEKAAEGQYEDIVAEYRAARSVYTAINEQLNLGLSVQPVNLLGTKNYETSRTILFDLVTSPFAKPMSPDVPVPAGVKLGPDANPVSSYYMILVNEKNKTTFSITEAEAIILKGPGNYIQINVTPSYLAPKTGSQTEQTFVPAVLTRVDTNTTVPVLQGRANLLVDFFNVNQNHKLLDSEGKPADMGTDYVVFLMAVYDNTYKRKLNNFEDYLSATSNTFTMAYVLQEVNDVEAAQMTTESSQARADWYTMDIQKVKVVPDTHEITFSVTENPAFSGEVEYRTILLPQLPETMHGLLTRSTVHDLQKEVDVLEQIADTYDPMINESYDRLQNMRVSFERIGFLPFTQMTNPPTTSEQQVEMSAEYRDLLQKYKDATGEQKEEYGITIKIMQAEFKRIGFIPYIKDTPPPLQKTNPETTQPQQNTYNAEYNVLNDAYASAYQQKELALRGIQEETVDNFSFLFNLRLAEQVSPGNYTLPSKYNVQEDPNGGWPVYSYVVPFGPETTDNFGNPLVPNHTYDIVVLSISTAPSGTQSMFVNNWTGDDAVIPTVEYIPPSDPKEGDETEQDGQESSSSRATRSKKAAKKNKSRKK